MAKKLLGGLQWTAAITLGLLSPCLIAHSQTSTKPALLSTLQTGAAIPRTSVAPQPPFRATRPAAQPMTPFERIIAPHMSELMTQSAAGKTKAAAVLSQSAATGVGGSSVNFPGFVSVPFLTIKDGDSSTAFNSVSGDFNHDGRMDVAMVKTDGTIEVLLNPGSFSGIANLTPITSNNNGNPGSLYVPYVIVADMNGDGFPDLVGQDIQNNQIVIWIGKGDGTFGPPNTYPVTLASGATWASTVGGSIFVGDFNGDGAPDVATLTSSPNYVPGASNTVISEVTFLNTGAGQLSPLAEKDTTFQDYYATGYDESTVVTSDGSTPSAIAFLVNDSGVNNSSNEGTSVVTLASNGDGTFKAPVEPSNPLIQNYILSIYGYGTVVATNLSANVSSGGNVPTTDLVFMTGDGAVYDAPYSSGNPVSAHVLVGLNTQLFAFGGAFVPPVTAPPAPPSLISTPIPSEFTINVADMNGDGLPDLVVYSAAAVSIFPNAGKGVFTAAPTQMVGATPGVQQPQPSNYDGSKFNSFLNVDLSLDEIAYFQNLGSAASVQGGQFLAAPLTTGTNTDGNYEIFGANVQVVATADIDGDGLQDLIAMDISNLGNGPSDVVVGFRNSAGAGNQSSNYTFQTVVKGQDLYTISNGLDFVEPFAISNAAGTSIMLVTNPGALIITLDKTGKAGKPVSLTFAKTPPTGVLNYGDVGDVNGDGIPDLVIAYGGDSAVQSGFYTFLGNADGTFQPGAFTALGSKLYQVRLVNLSGTAGNLDIAAIDQNFDTDTFAVYVVPNKADGKGNFDIEKTSKPVSGYIVSDIVAGDYNSDGKQDLTLLTAGSFDPSISTVIPNTSGVLLLPGNGDYTFGTPTLVDPGHFPQWGTYADFNGDGNPDLALTEINNLLTEQAETPLVQILPNLGGGIFGNPIAEFSSFNSFLPGQVRFTSYTFAGKFTNSGGPDLLVTSTYGTSEFVNKGVTTLALTASSTTANQGAPVTFTATISQAVSAGVVETGSVAFTANGTALGATPVTDGVATFTTALPVGSDTITATYAGDSNHNQAAATLAVSVAAVAPALALSATPATLTLTQGATGTVIVSLAGNSTFSGVVQISCTGMPAETSCVSSPASVTLGAGQSTALSIVVATTPPNNTYQAKELRRVTPWTGTLGGFSLAGLAFILWPRRRRLPRGLTALLLAVLSLSSIGALTGCSGNNGSNKTTTNQYAGTVAGTYTLTVTATSGTLSQTQAIALTVMQSQ
jgi:Bacterial Ig-like domain (group 3)/FG-GAP-like repeat